MRWIKNKKLNLLHPDPPAVLYHLPKRSITEEAENRKQKRNWVPEILTFVKALSETDFLVRFFFSLFWESPDPPGKEDGRGLNINPLQQICNGRITLITRFVPQCTWFLQNPFQNLIWKRYMTRERLYKWRTFGKWIKFQTDLPVSNPTSWKYFLDFSNKH